MKLLKKLSLFILFIFLIKVSFSEVTEAPFKKFVNAPWVTAQLERLSLEDKIAQLMVITVYPKQNDGSKSRIIEQIINHKPGGIIVMQGSPTKTVNWINEFQENSEVPLLVSIDAEWGLSMRIDSTMEYPHAQAIGAVQDSTFILQMGRDFGLQLKQMGMHMNFGPVADVNTNPNNPVINFRSYGEDKINVAHKAWFVAKGMQDVGIIPVAKHFPGHGDTKTDSHKALPLLEHSKARMDSIESYPFRFLAEKGISGIMSAHLNVPSLDATGKPSSISKKIITDYLKNEIGYTGFVVTDAINMKGVRTKAGNTELAALIAGNDIVEFVPDLKKAIASVKSGVEKGEITEEEINNKCRTVLALKRWVGLNEYKPANVTNLRSRLNSPYYEVTSRKLVKGSFTILQNDGSIPVQHLDTLKIASLSIGGIAVSGFQKMLDNYTKVDHYCLPKNATEKTWATLREKLENYNLVIGGIEGIHIYPSGRYGTSEIQRRAVAELVQETNSVFVFFGNAYALKYFKNIHHANVLVLAYQNSNLSQELAAQLIFGGFDANGKLPVTIDKRFRLNVGDYVKKNNSLAYTIPEIEGIDSELLEQKIDSIANLGIEKEAYPGCQVLVAKNGNVIFHKCYGYHTYDKSQQVKKENIYDWASITKVTGPLPALMKFVDEEKINLDSPFSNYWPGFKKTNKENLKVREILAHQARLLAWIPFWTMTLDENGDLDGKIFKNTPSKEFNIRISENMYMNNNFRKTMLDTIQNSRLLQRKRYLYSGLTFYLYPDIIEKLGKKPYEKYVKENFYTPLGAHTVTFNAYKHFPLKNIIPTENDDFFRNEKIRGFVHDEGAAMMGGISGNAGLFGTTNDLAKIFQMYLQKGYYGGKRYISEKTVNEFIRIQYPDNKNRRGLGFDKPVINNHLNSLEDAFPAIDASKSSFGHSGYTGTFAWADPDKNLLFIFMSNRVHPTRENTKIYQLNIRTAMHQAIYDCIKTGIN